MPATPAAIHKQKQRPAVSAPPTTKAAQASAGQLSAKQTDENSTVRLHITPFTPALLKVYLAPSLLPLAENISYHTVETFPDKGFGYVDLPTMEAQKLKKKLNGATLKGSKVRIEEAKPEKRKAVEDAEVVDEKLVKRAKKEKKKKEQGLLEGVELPEGRKVKRGWTESPAKNKKDKKEKKTNQRDSRYTKEPELLFNAKLTPVAATEVARKEKSKDKKGKKDKKKSKSTEVVVHEFEQNSKQPSFLKSTQVSAEPKPAVEYVNGKGWVDEDGNVVEAETGKARNRRVLELVDPASPLPTTEKKASATPEAEPSPTSKKAKPAKKGKKKQVTPPTPSSESDAKSSVVSSSSENEASDAEPDTKSSASSPALAPDAPQVILTPSSPNDEKKDVHPLEALFKRPKPPSLSSSAFNSTSTPAKLAPINTSFSFFGSDDTNVNAGMSGNPPVTPFTQKDLEWRGLRSAAPTPDTAAIGRRFSFPWRNGSQEVDEEGDDDDVEAGKQLSNNTKVNSSLTHLPDLAEEDEEENEHDASDQDQGLDGEDDEEIEGEANQTPLGARRSTRIKENGSGDGAKEESEFGKWFWENRGDNNRAWKKRRRDTLKAQRLRENKKVIGGRRV